MTAFHDPAAVGRTIEADGPGRTDPALRQKRDRRHRDATTVSGDAYRLRARTVFISDLHLGTRACKAALLRSFLQAIDCQTLYLVGDIIDCCELKAGSQWPHAHHAIVDALLDLARRGTRVIYLLGNHDRDLADYVGEDFGGIELLSEHIHVTADGRRLLVMHGDMFDAEVHYSPVARRLGIIAYDILLLATSACNGIRRWSGLPYFSLSAFVKSRVTKVARFIAQYEEAVADGAAGRGVDGVVCGHIHAAATRRFGTLTYYNAGDWVESCTALVEHQGGAVELVDWRAWIGGSLRRKRPAAALDTASA